MRETRFTGLAGRGRGAERTGVVLWQNRVEIQTVMFHCSLGKDNCLSLNVTAELYGLTGAAGWCCWLLLVLVLLVGFLVLFFFPTSTTLCFFQYRTCKWEFMFSATMRYGRWILKADRLKYIQFARSKFRSSFTGVQDFQSWALPEEETLLGARAVRASLRRNAARPSRAAQCRWRRRRLQYLASLPPRALIWLFPLALRLRCEASEGASEGGAVSRCALPRDRVRLNYANRIQKWNQQQLMWNGCVNKVSAFTGRLC